MSNKTITILNIENDPILISKIKVKSGTSLYEGKIVLFYQINFESKSKKVTKQLKAKDAGVLSKIFVKEGDVIDKSGELFSYVSGCSHSTIMNDLCAECGFDLQKDDSNKNLIASVPMVHTIPMLKVSEERAKIIGKADAARLIEDKKLVLLVDLDQTLIHTTNDNIPPNIKDVHHFQLPPNKSTWYHTRLRPGTLQFLESISQWFELHICTFGSRNYAHQIAHFLDKNGKYFSHRILSRDECFDSNSKTANLRALFPCGDNMVCIIDDREDVWNYAENLIHVKPYHFFRHTGDINAPPGLGKCDNDEREGYTVAQLAQGVRIKKVPSRNKKDGDGDTEEGKPLIKQDENEPKELTSDTQDTLKDNLVLNKDPELSLSDNCDKESIILPSKIDKDIISPDVEQEIKVLEEKISSKHREIVSIVKHVRSKSFEETKNDDDPADDKKKSISTESPMEVELSERPFQVEEPYVPEPIRKITIQTEYIPTIVTPNIEYVPSSSTNSNTLLNSPPYTPTNALNEPLQYVPSSVKLANKDDVSISVKEYIPSTKSDKTNSASEEIEYIPSSKKETGEVTNITINDSNVLSDSGVEYTPSRTTNTEYVPSGIRHSLNYIPTSKDELEYVPAGSSVDVIMEYTPSSSTVQKKYVPSDTNVHTTTEYTPSSSSEKIEYVPSDTSVNTKIEYTPTSTREQNEYVPSDTGVLTITIDKKMKTEYVPLGVDSEDDVKYVPSKIRNKENDGSASMNRNETSGKRKHKSEDSKDEEMNESEDSNSTNKKRNKNTSSDEMNKKNRETTKDLPEDSKNDEDLPGTETKNKDSNDDLIEVEEIDDYLLYLEEILKHIHERFYEIYNRTKIVPDLKQIVPNMKSNVLKDIHIVFSGVVPSKMKLVDNKSYLVAKSLGADVEENISDTTTHLVAVRTGTAKVNEARKKKNIFVVTLDWLWMCAERWERVDERLFPISHKASSSRIPPAHCASPEHKPSSPQPIIEEEDKFVNTINPLMTLSSEELANMDKEVEDMFNEDDDDEDTDVDDSDRRQSGKRKREEFSSSSSVESLSGDRKGWSSPQEIVKKNETNRLKRKRKRAEYRQKTIEKNKNSSRTLSSIIDNATKNITNETNNIDLNQSNDRSNIHDSDSSINDDIDEDDDFDIDDGEDDFETINSKFRRCAKIPSDCEFDSSQGSDEENDETLDDIEWNNLGAALEREFTGN